MGKYQRKLRTIYDVVHDIHDRCEDEGDRIYLGSTEDRHTLKRQLRYLEKLIPDALLYPTLAATQPATSQEGEGKLDWRKIAKAAGEHGVRYRTNAALERFLSEIAATPTPPTLSDDLREEERRAISAYLIACAVEADRQSVLFADQDRSICDGCRQEAKAYRNAARMIDEDSHASYRAALAQVKAS